MNATSKQIEQVKRLIQTELLKRGFQAPIIRAEEVENRNGGTRFEFNTEPFQTTPVIFESIIVDNFSSSIKRETRTRPEGHNADSDQFEVTVFWVQVHVSYKHFGGGSNGCSLFDLRAEFFEDDDRISKKEIW